MLQLNVNVEITKVYLNYFDDYCSDPTPVESAFSRPSTSF
jgi:hypothetical protein